MSEKYVVSMRTAIDKNGKEGLQSKVWKKKAFFDQLPKKIQDKYIEYGIDINNVDEDGDFFYWSPLKTVKEILELDLIYSMREKGFHIELLNRESLRYFDLLQERITKKFSKNDKIQYLWDGLLSKSYPHQNVMRVLEERIKNGNVIMFFGGELENRYLWKNDIVFSVKSFKYNPNRNYQWLTEFDDFNAPYEYITTFDSEKVTNEGFITDTDMTWVYCFNHEGIAILVDL